MGNINPVSLFSGGTTKKRSSGVKRQQQRRQQTYDSFSFTTSTPTAAKETSKKKKNNDSSKNNNDIVMQPATQLTCAGLLTQFQVVSDLHLEMLNKGTPFTDKLPPALAPVLIMAGDIYAGREPDFGTVMRTIAARYKHVVYVPGNHEFYGFRWSVYAHDEVLEYMKRVCRDIPNLHFLYNSSVVIDGVTFFGGTMWTNIPESEFPLTHFKMGDFSVIGFRSNPQKPVRELSPEDVVGMHMETTRHLDSTIQAIRDSRQQCQQLVVVTHHAPSMAHMRSFTRGDQYKAFYYSTDIDRFLTNPPVTAWIHGHTHSSSNVVTAGGTRIIANARGYDAPSFQELNPEYDPRQVVSLYANGQTVVETVSM